MYDLGTERMNSWIKHDVNIGCRGIINTFCFKYGSSLVITHKLDEDHLHKYSGIH